VRGSGGKIVHFVRHGEAMHNPRAEALRTAGCTFDEFLLAMAADDVFDAPLTTLGIAQATETHSSLLGTSVAPEVVLVSPLSRAIDTAKTIFPCGPFFAVDELCERRGWLLNTKRRRRSELAAAYPLCDFAALSEDDELWTEQLEEWPSCSARGRAALERVWLRPEREVAVVCHGGILDAILGMRDDVHADADLKGRFHNAECRSAELNLDPDGVSFQLKLITRG